jgi:hypothetical protein
MGEAELLQRFRQCRLMGGILLQAMLSFIPFASGPHAAVWASRVASGSEAAEAVALFWRPLNATVTEHSTRWEERVDQRRNAAKATSTSTDRNLAGAVMFASYRDPAAGSRPQRNQVAGPAVLLPTGRKERGCQRVRCMECKEVLVRLWEYLDEELRAEEAEAVAAHLGRCRDCYPAYCCDRALLELLARQRKTCSAPAALVMSIRIRLRVS